ncbi:hypothetical protein [Parafrigoribacterium humi]|uniref:hypothetical protein n=1 Tax=Parafrigoribacterium humi TaxID=3144664 RepID=UPI0032EF3BE1
MTVVITALLVITGAIPAHALTTDASTALESITAVDPGALALTVGVSETAESLTASSGHARIAVPTEARDGISLQISSQSLAITLPFANQANKGVVERAGVMSFDNNNGSVTVPIVKTDGSVQINTVISRPDAPNHYRYGLDLPTGSLIRPEGGGFLLFDASGENIGAIAAPWAFDATGKAVPTRYEVSGTTITQVVDHSAEFQYPIVADPTYIAPITIIYSRADVERMWNVMNFTGSACKFAPLPYLASLACAAPATLADAVASAHYQKKRIKALYYQCNSGSWCNYYTYKIIS